VELADVPIVNLTPAAVRKMIITAEKLTKTGFLLSEARTSVATTSLYFKLTEK
jgi:hypothetical protein